MIHVIITGNLGADAELRSTSGGAVCNFRVAAKDHKGETAWFRCALWGKRGESAAKYMTKGSTVTVVGGLRFTEYQGKPQYEVDASEVAFGGKPKETTGAAAGASDEIPF